MPSLDLLGRQLFFFTVWLKATRAGDEKHRKKKAVALQLLDNTSSGFRNGDEFRPAERLGHFFRGREVHRVSRQCLLS